VKLRIFSSWVAYIFALPRFFKQGLVITLDIILCVFTVWFAFYLRLGYFVSPISTFSLVTLVSVALALPIFVASGLYRAIFRYSGMPAMLALTRTLLIYGLIFFASIIFFEIEGVPRTIGLIQPVLLFLLVGFSRVLAKVWLGDLYHKKLRKESLPQALIYGAGNAGSQLATALAGGFEVRVMGFLDDDKRLHGHLVNGLLISDPADLAKILTVLPITVVLLALPNISRQRRNNILNSLKPYKVQVRTMPSLSDIAIGKVGISDLLDLEIDDLLGREPVLANHLLLKANIHKKTVLVTGAGGSIGSELCRQIFKNKPKRLLMVEMSEFALYQIHQELLLVSSNGLSNTPKIFEADVLYTEFEPESISTSDDIELVPLLASVCNEERMREIMVTWKPDTVYHAAAYKHVPLVEHNPVEGVRNNVWGTLVCAQVAAETGVRNFVLISSDKAVRPTNIMGATKRLAEMVLQALAGLDGASCSASQNRTFENGSNELTINFSMVRFGNVLCSSGSVVPLFRDQIKCGGPITLTHKDMTRYFMTIPEAAELVIQAGAMGQGGDVFVLDMGQPVKIIDLARRMVELSGLTVCDDTNMNGDIKLVEIGLRPGEKLFEELLIGNTSQATQHPRIMRANEKFLTWPQLKIKLCALDLALKSNDMLLIRAQLQEIVDDYQPNGGVVDLVHMAKDDVALVKK
jgi:FlaA1/EpsC-like NDP-sugar epimerase